MHYTKILLWTFQILALLVSLFHRKKQNETCHRFVPYFLLYVVLTEALGYFIPMKYNISNQFVYNTFTVVSFLFYWQWFSCVLKKSKLLTPFLILFISCVIIAIFTENFMDHLWKLPLIAASVIIFVMTMFYYHELLESEEVIHFFKLPNFWISTGLMVFYIGFIPLFLLQNYLNIHSIYYQLALMILNIALYGSFIISILCKHRK